MFKKILIANRGEIACRVMASAKRRGIATVAVYSDADATAKHVALADEAVHIGGASASESYLRIERILDAAVRTGAEAIHPGYGFLAENSSFVEAVEAAGVTFIGPPASAIRAMGLKDAAKQLMEKSGVPVVPGYHGDNQNAEFLAAQAEIIGYPVLIKARAGGGGKGMRKVDEPVAFFSAFEAAQREGQSSFGDPLCLIEKYVAKPRHVEIQVLGDAHGNIVHLFERDCSLQRRHQKVIEEAPAPDMPAEVRAAMGAAAVDAAKAIGYEGAGTVEFIADGSDGLALNKFWFMEMNTRLQVEHPVTEAITGLDLVDLQFRVAAGEPLPFTQDALSINGHAFEARIYAEDAAREFLPAIGKLQHVSMPDASEFAAGPVRVDSGVVQGDEISSHYDPMIAKLIVHGSNREDALGRLSAALSQTHIAGTTTNVAFLSRLSQHCGFANGDVDTGLIARDIDVLTQPVEPSETMIAAASVIALGLSNERGNVPSSPPAQSNDPWNSLVGWRHWSRAQHQVELIHEREHFSRSITLGARSGSAGQFTVASESGAVELKLIAGKDGARIAVVDGLQKKLHSVDLGSEVVLFSVGEAFTFTRVDPLAHGDDDSASGDHVAAPLPGLVQATNVGVGAKVKAGDQLVILEAMKMEYVLVAPRDGTIAEMCVDAGDQVAEGVMLVRLEPEHGDD